MTQPTFLLSPIKPAIPAQGGAIDVMVRLQAPDQPEGSKAKVTPKRLSLVVDRSGSMDGQPLQEALRCVGHIAARMTALSNYLGHANPSGTYWYLSAAPELMELAAARLDDRRRP